MPIGRFIAMVGFLVWRRSDGKYLLLRRSPNKDFAPGEWETGSGRLDQGEGFAAAALRESREELGVEARIEFILGTTHFYRGEPTPDNDMVGVSFGCSVPDESSLSFSEEHTEHRWMTCGEASDFRPDTGSPLLSGALNSSDGICRKNCVNSTGTAVSSPNSLDPRASFPYAMVRIHPPYCDLRHIFYAFQTHIRRRL